MIRGERIVLTALDKANMDTVRGWLNSPEVNRHLLTGHIPVTVEEEVSFYERMAASSTDHVLEIHLAEDMRLIGHVGLHGVDMVHRTGELGIFIGEVSLHGQGLGRDAIVTMLGFAFDTLGLHRVLIRARGDNERGLHLYRAVGFTECGVDREAVFGEGRFFDEVRLDMLEAEYRSRYSAS
jgi:RimJ/RimL family protein N-acetyltransferase